MALGRLKKRSEFLRLRGGFRAATSACVIEAKPNAAPRDASAAVEDLPARFGYTVTKKLGGAVVRNRIRRRLKAAVAAVAPALALPGYDYVVVARRQAADAAWADLQDQVAQSLKRIARLSKSGQPSAP